MADHLTAFREEIRGTLIPAVPVPFASSGGIYRSAQQEYARWMAHQPVGAVCVWAHTGRGLNLSREQRASVLEDWRTHAPSVPLVCGVGIPLEAELPEGESLRIDRGIELAVAMGRQAAEGGAQALMVHPPRQFAGAGDASAAVLNLYEALQELGLPLIGFYLYREAAGILFDRQLVERLADLPSVVAFKVATLDSVITYQELAHSLRSRSDCLLITGEDRFLGYSLMLGADAALVGVAAVGTGEISRLIENWFSEDWDGFLRMSGEVDRFGAVTFREPLEGYPQRLLWALEVEAGLSGELVDPLGPTLSSDERTLVQDSLRRLKSHAGTAS